MKLITPGVFDLISKAKEGNIPSGNYVGEVGLAPLHDIDAQIPAEVKAKIAKQQNILLMVCDRCAVERDLGEGDFTQCGFGQVKARGLVEGVVAGCFPQLYEALSGNPPDQVITL
jgi:sulfur relay (sulfurtransferase) complex TusBCD TusD component (DsrE family)